MHTFFDLLLLLDLIDFMRSVTVHDHSGTTMSQQELTCRMAVTAFLFLMIVMQTVIEKKKDKKQKEPSA